MTSAELLPLKVFSFTLIGFRLIEKVTRFPSSSSYTSYILIDVMLGDKVYHN